MASIIELSFFLIIGGIISFYVGIKKLRQKKMMESLQTSKIRSLAIGLVEIFGEVVPNEIPQSSNSGPLTNYRKALLDSPLTNMSCVYYKVVEETKIRGVWVPISKKEEHVPFYLRDETGTVMVDLTDANCTLSEGHQDYGPGTRKTEYTIVPGDTIYILGRADNNLHITGLNRIYGTTDLMIRKSKSPRVYEVVDQPEKEFIASMGRVVPFSVIGGGAMIVGGLVLMFLNIGF